MPLHPKGPAPYGPPQTIIDLLEAYRDRGLGTPFTPDVLARAGVSDGLTARVMASLRLLDLIDKEGMPTEQLLALAQARGDEEYKTALAGWLRETYSDVLNFADLEHDSPDRITEAFRGYTPAGQRSRMVTLMLGLFRYAGIIKEIPKRDPVVIKRQSLPRLKPADEIWHDQTMDRSARRITSLS